MRQSSSTRVQSVAPLKFLLLGLLGMHFPAGAYQPNIQKERVARIEITSENWNIPNGAIDFQALQKYDSLLIEMPLKGRDLCDIEPGVDIPVLYFVSRAAHKDGSDGVKDYLVLLEKNQISLRVVADPTVNRTTRISNVFFNYKLLDRIPFDSCQDPSAEITLGVYLNKGNTYITLTTDGSPTRESYASPINFGLGREIYDQLFTNKTEWNLVIQGVSDFPTLKGTPRAWVNVYGFHWRFDANNPETVSNLLDDLNLNYGGKALPVASPVLNAGFAAAAAIQSVAP